MGGVWQWAWLRMQVLIFISRPYNLHCYTNMPVIILLMEGKKFKNDLVKLLHVRKLVYIYVKNLHQLKLQCEHI